MGKQPPVSATFRPKALIDAIKAIGFIEIKGEPACRSQFNKMYLSWRNGWTPEGFGTTPMSFDDSISAAITMMREEWNKGARAVVWRKRPVFMRRHPNSRRPLGISFRCHFLNAAELKRARIKPKTGNVSHG